MSTNRINIRSIVLGIIAIAISISIGYGIARVDGAQARVSLDRGRDLDLRSALRPTGLRADLQAGLAREALLESAALDGLNLKGGKLGELGTLEGRLHG